MRIDALIEALQQLRARADLNNYVVVVAGPRRQFWHAAKIGLDGDTGHTVIMLGDAEGELLSALPCVGDTNLIEVK